MAQAVTLPSAEALKLAEAHVGCDRLKSPTPGCVLHEHADSCSVTKLALDFDAFARLTVEGLTRQIRYLRRKKGKSILQASELMPKLHPDQQ